MLVLAVAASGMLLTACLKSNVDNNNSQTPVAALMGFNLAPDQPAVAITLSGNSLSQSPLAYTNYTGLYQNIYTGTRTVQSLNNQAGNSLLASTDFNFEADKYYSAFLVGYNNHYRHVISTDMFDSLSNSQGNAYIRYINAIADSTAQPSVTIAAGSNNIVSENASFASISGFRAVTPGSVNIAVKSGTAIDTSRAITVEQNKVYTVLLVGVPGATDATQRVQIKFIENGTLTGSNGG